MKINNRDFSPESNLPKEVINVQTFAKQMLQTRLFVGTFLEKRYVDKLQSYRDLVVVSSEEKGLIKDLEIVKKRLQNMYQNCWIGITGSNVLDNPGVCLWVQLSEEVFGSYWYKISKVRFRNDEVLLVLKKVRPVVDDDASSINVSEKLEPSPELDLDLKSIYQKGIATICDNFQNGISQAWAILTFKNFKEAVKFTSILVVLVFTALLQFLSYMGDFTIRLAHELSGIVTAVTPIVITFINLIGKIIGGFYILIAMLWRDRKGTMQVHPDYINRNNALTYGSDQHNKPLNYRRAIMQYPNTNTSSVKITELH